MNSKNIVLWEGKSAAKIPFDTIEPASLLSYAVQLRKRDVEQIEAAFQSKHYEIASTYIWSKSISSLKRQLSKLGIKFIAEMLDRQDIDEFSNIEEKLTDFEAIQLAEELGIINSIGTFRLHQSLGKMHHFGSIDDEESEQYRMTSDEGIGILRACIENILGQDKIDVSLDFQKFRNKLENKLITEDSNDIRTLQMSPYFFKRASIRILLSLIKTTSGAQMENVLANSNVIMPLLWPELSKPDKWQIGRNYSDVFIDGKSKAASGLKKVLLKVKGFDYVPEDLRSKSYLKAARNVLNAHYSANNYYDEPAPMKFLYSMGSVIPIPAFHVCMTAVLSVKLGNYHGICFDAQEPAGAMLKEISKDRWLYFLNDCLPTNERLLHKFLLKPVVTRWCSLVRELNLKKKTTEDIHVTFVRQLVVHSHDLKMPRVIAIAKKMIDKLGHKTE